MLALAHTRGVSVPTGDRRAAEGDPTGDRRAAEGDPTGDRRAARALDGRRPEVIRRG